MANMKENCISGQVIDYLSFLRIRGEVARALLEAVDKENGGKHFSSFREMALSLCISPEMVSKSLISLQEKGAVRLGHGRIKINRDSLFRIAAG